MKRYESKYVVCPFYHNEDSLVIYCEGITEDSTLLNTFRRLDGKNDYKKKCCCSMDGHKECPIAKFLFAKY